MKYRGRNPLAAWPRDNSRLFQLQHWRSKLKFIFAKTKIFLFYRHDSSRLVTTLATVTTDNSNTLKETTYCFAIWIKWHSLFEDLFSLLNTLYKVLYTSIKILSSFSDFIRATFPWILKLFDGVFDLICVCVSILKTEIHLWVMVAQRLGLRGGGQGREPQIFL